VIKPLDGEKRMPVSIIWPDDELRRRNLAAIALLDEWERDGAEQEQRETMDVIRAALGENREMSNRPLFP